MNYDDHLIHEAEKHQGQPDPLEDFSMTISPDKQTLKIFIDFGGYTFSTEIDPEEDEFWTMEKANDYFEKNEQYLMEQAEQYATECQNDYED